MSSNAVRRTAIGFQGGQVLSLRLPEEVLTSLRETLKQGKERWVEVEASDGAVLVDGTDIRQLDPTDLRQSIGCVLQDPHLFF